MKVMDELEVRDKLELWFSIASVLGFILGVLALLFSCMFIKFGLSRLFVYVVINGFFVLLNIFTSMKITKKAVNAVIDKAVNKV